MHEGFLNFVFYVFAGITVFAAFFAVVQKNPVRGVLFLVLAFFGSAGVWMLAHAEFLALILVLVYVGAVMTLFLFVVMMLNIDTEVQASSLKRLPWLVLGAAVFVALLLQALPKDIESLGVAASVMATETSELSNTAAIGMVLYQEDILAFELAGMILLVAIIGAITLTHRRPKKMDKKQDIVKQIMTRGDTRVKLVKMKAERLRGEGT